MWQRDSFVQWIHLIKKNHVRIKSVLKVIGNPSIYGLFVLFKNLNCLDDIYIFPLFNQSSIWHCGKCWDVIECGSTFTGLLSMTAILNFPSGLEGTFINPSLRCRTRILQGEREKKEVLLLTGVLLFWLTYNKIKESSDYNLKMTPGLRRIQSSTYRHTLKKKDSEVKVPPSSFC